MMREEGLGVGGGATYFLTSLLDHPDFTPEHLALMPVRRAGRLGRCPEAVTRRATDLGIKVVPLLRQHRAPVDHRLACSTTPRSSGSPPTAVPCPGSRSAWTTTARSSAAGPTASSATSTPS